MSNSLLTVDKITREALDILHQKANFLATIDRQYDDAYTSDGAKIGDTLRIRLPNEYVIREGNVMVTQDVEETNTTLQKAIQRGVDINFSIKDLSDSLDDFSERILDPAVAVLVSNVEAIVSGVYKDVYQMVDNDGSAISYKNVMQGRQMLVDALTPDDGKRCAMLSTDHQVNLADALKALFNPASAMSKAYRDGQLARQAGFDFFENTHFSDHTSGTAAKTTGYLVDGVAESGSAITVDTGSTTFLVGDVITIADVNRVHPETKANTGKLQQFVITADSGASATSLSISPSLTISGPRQNVDGYPADDAAIVKIGAGASELLNTSMVYHKNAFTFATTDLLMPEGVDFASRQVFDGVSLCIVRDYDIVNHKMPCRMDIMFGYKTIRPQLAARIHADG